MFKSGFVSIVGRANVGKSTLINTMVGKKVSIVSSKPQTTRNKLLGIITEEKGQLILVDTPGMHKPKNQLDNYMIKIINDSLKEVDAILFVIDVSCGVGPGDLYMLSLLPKTANVMLILNKIDLAVPEDIKKAEEELCSKFDFNNVFACSALEYEQVSGIKDAIFDILPEGPKYYPDSEFSSMSDDMLISEIIREKALMYLDQEIPHGIAVRVDSIKDNPSSIEVEASIIVERNSHKGIVIGKKGRKLKGIIKSARADMAKLFGMNVYLSILVKVKKNWRSSLHFTREYGYRDY